LALASTTLKDSKMDDRTEQEITARLDYVEKYLVHLGATSGYGYATFATSKAAAPEVMDLARQGKTNDAIKLYRKRTNANLQQAQDVIAQLQAGEKSPFGSGPDSSGQDVGIFGPASAPFWPEASYGAGVPADIVAMAQSGQLVRAVKLYKAQTGLDLKEAKAAVEQAAGGH
jgi:ribosomal protein L7/L12